MTGDFDVQKRQVIIFNAFNASQVPLEVDVQKHFSCVNIYGTWGIFESNLKCVQHDVKKFRVLHLTLPAESFEVRFHGPSS